MLLSAGGVALIHPHVAVFGFEDVAYAVASVLTLMLVDRLRHEHSSDDHRMP